MINSSIILTGDGWVQYFLDSCDVEYTSSGVPLSFELLNSALNLVVILNMINVLKH